MKTNYSKPIAIFKSTLKVFLVWFFVSGNASSSFAQCPPNIDFEQGDFRGWECWTGHTFDVGGKNAIIWDPPGLPVPPDPNRHRMLSSFPGDGRDPYGLFPKNCPNGSGHSIQLGNTTGGHEAEGVSYTFTIPAGQNQFNLIYNYAVVFQDPGHAAYEQPRLQIEIKNLTDNTTITCSSFDFIASSSLPGFFKSPNPGGPTDVWCKNWSANTIKLDGLAGKTIQLFFKSADCVFTAHFGYAYIDVNTECSSSFVGAAYCPDDAFINVTAPFGYQTYTWWDAGFTTILGTAQTINFTPPPPSGTTIAVVIDPYAGYGCRDTLYANLLDTLTLQANAGPDQLSCNKTPVQLGVNSRPGYVYSWSPPLGLSNPNISNPIATPTVTTRYVVTVSNAGGGCLTRDTVIVSAAVLDSSLQMIGPGVFCYNPASLTILKVNPADSIQWYLNNTPITGANQAQYIVTQSGAYQATIFSFLGCSANTVIQNITVHPAPVPGFSINITDQCFTNNQFIYTNSSSISSGTLQYKWDLGDGTVATTTDISHTYARPGTYLVKLIVTSDKGCIDSARFTVTVNASPVAGFNINKVDQCFKGHQFVFSNTSTLSTGSLLYRWNMGDGNIITSKDVTHSYLIPDAYFVKLVITTDKGCMDSSSFVVNVNPSPIAGFTVNTAQQCFANNQFNFTNTTVIPGGTVQYLWNLGDGTTMNTTDVIHNYSKPGDYIVKMLVTSNKGCADSSTFTVKVFPFANADFTVQPVCINLKLPLLNRTINNTATGLNYLWDFGNGQSSILQNPVYSYTAAGTYKVNLTVNTNQCLQTFTSKQIEVVIDAPAKGITYPEKDAVINFPEPLQARFIGSSVLWTPATNLDFRYSYNPKFTGIVPQLYTIQLKTLTGCVTVDTQMVKTHKKIEIYVPASFTPDNNGINDYLRPILMGFTSVNYFRVYNRWGKLLYQMQSDKPGWDGTINGARQQMQAVVWMIEATDVDGKIHKRQGTSILLR